MSLAKQKGNGALLLIVIVALIAVGMGMTVFSEKQAIKNTEAEVTAYARQITTIQNRALKFYKDTGDWPQSLEQLNTIDSGKYNTGVNASPAGTGFLFDTSSGWLQIQSNANNRVLAKKVAALVVDGKDNNGVVTSTLKNPYEIDAYDDYLQKVENPNDASRTRLETDIDWNHRQLTNVGRIDGQSVDFQEFDSSTGDINETTVNSQASVGNNTLSASGRALNIGSSKVNTNNISARVARLAELDASRVDAQNYSADDYMNADTSLNTIEYERQALQQKLDECMYVTEWCFPKAPEISQMVCEPNCYIVKEDNSFSAKLRARVSQCQHGCNYSWELGGASGLCGAGTVSQGGYKSLSCNISGNVPPESTRSHTVKITALNSIDTTKKTTKNYSVTWENTTSDNPFKEVKAGCYIDTSDYDLATENSCMEGGLLGNGKRLIRFSVGNVEPYNNGANDRNEDFEFDSGTNAQIEWTGDCVGTGGSCVLKYYKGKSFVATAKVTINGTVQTYTVGAIDERTSGPLN